MDRRVRTSLARFPHPRSAESHEMLAPGNRTTKIRFVSLIPPHPGTEFRALAPGKRNETERNDSVRGGDRSSHIAHRVSRISHRVSRIPYPVSASIRVHQRFRFHPHPVSRIAYPERLRPEAAQIPWRSSLRSWYHALD